MSGIDRIRLPVTLATAFKIAGGGCGIASSEAPVIHAFVLKKEMLTSGIVHARDLELVEVVFDGCPVLDRRTLVHGIVISPRHLPFDLLADCDRMHERKPLLERNINSVEFDLATLGDFQRVHLRANGLRYARWAAAIVDGDAPRPTFR